MTSSTNPLRTLLAAGLVAAAGLAAPADAQTSTTSISINDGKVEGHSVRIIDGTKYKITFDEDGVTHATIDGEEAEFEVEGDAVTINHDGKLVEFEMPRVGNGANRFMIGRPAEAPRVWAGEGNNFFVDVNQPKTMVGLTQRPIDEQLREHLELKEGVGTVILSVVEGLPADKAGMKKGDVLVSVEGKDVTGSEVLTDALTDLEPGDTIDVTVLRKGLPETLTITVAPFDGQKLYGERFPFRGQEPFGGNNIFRLGIDNNDLDLGFDFGEIEDMIRGEVEGLKDLTDEERQEFDRAMAEARKQVAEAMEQARRIRGLEWNADGDLLLRPGDRDRAIVIERQAQREREAAERLADRQRMVEGKRSDLEAEAETLRARNLELESRLEAMEAKLERLIDLLESKEGDD